MNILRFTSALWALAGGCAAIACEYPPLVTIPAGNESTLEEMLQAQSEVRTYVVAMEAYLACVDAELTTAGDDSPEEFKSILFSRHNAAFVEMEAVAAHFNEQVQIYRCTGGTETGTPRLEANEDCAATSAEE